MVAPARKLAFEILGLVEQGGWAGELLLARGGALDGRDRGLAVELVMGALRHQRQLDYLIGHYSGRPELKLDAAVRIALRMGIYQLRYLRRIPAHAAVGESVELVKRARKASAAGFVNAVLRKVDGAEVAWPGKATECSLPDWLWERWKARYGEELAAGIGRAFLREPEGYIRVPPGREAEAAELGAEATEVAGCYVMGKGGAGPFRQQDIGSQSIVPLLELRAGDRFLDLCSAPGGKTAQALEAGVRAVACDRHWSRLKEMKELGCALVVLDGAAGLPFGVKFERILVDAPCSGTGTLGRNPEIRWRVQETDLADLHRRQVELCLRAAERLEPEGRMVYSTCSLETEENEEVIKEVLERGAGLECVGQMSRVPGREAGDGFFAAVLTSRKPASH
jgi:16S rRNA (cytosine967-C5)-methyltransferase